jgi:hypothetical protein
VKNLQSFDGLDALLRSADLQQKVAAGLAKDGILIDFGSAQGSHYWQVVKKPAGMTDQEVESKVWELLTHRLTAAWTFTVSNTP